ncbi:hypothetical protein DH2020_005323 [Rehmannia glutinosa]|uniref:Uncharacterized protein n=1 Tax=Rehmannia glutinosa TaxID=99300 RepID=A0ABR0XFS1_REHGL
MASGWMKSLQCNSKASDDVVHHQYHSNPKNHHHSPSCRNTVQSLKDIVEITKKPKPKKPKPPQTPPFKRPVSRRSEPGSNPHPTVRTRSIGAGSYFSSLTELPNGHPSRNVVEIIFQTSWGEKNFSGRVEMVLKIQNSTRTLSRFEEYRESVKYRASSCAAAGDGGEDHARCVADGNEVMRFYCLGDTGGAYESGGGAWGFRGGKRAAGVCTFPGSGVAHESAGGGRGRRAMLVCRAIAGRVCKQVGFDSLRTGYDSVGGENGELLVFDTRALLPCFLIIYKL